MNLTHQYFFSLSLMSMLLVCSAFFSCSETALFSLPPEEARRLRSSRRIEELLKILHEDPSGLLTAILFGNLVVNVLFFCSGAAAAGRLAEGHGEWVEALGGVLVLLTVILFGEIIPKAIGITHPSGVLFFAAVPLRSWFYFTRPFRGMIRRLFDHFGFHSGPDSNRNCLTRGELKELLDAVQHEPGFGLHEKEVLEDIVNLPGVRLREVMVPRVKLFRRPLDIECRELFEQVRSIQGIRYILIYRDNDDDPVGYVSARDLFMDGGRAKSIESLIQPLHFVPETKRADVLLREFMNGTWQMAVVVDEYGGLAGMVTVEDLLAEVIGDFEPAGEDRIQRLDDVTCRLSGQLPIRAWRELLTGFLPGQEIDTLAFETLGGFIISLLGRMPSPGDSVAIRNLELTVESMHHRRIGTVILRLNEPEVQS